MLCRSRLVLARGIGRADDREWVKAEMTRSRKARNESLQRDRVGRNQRRGFADRSRHGAILAPAAGTRLGRTLPICVGWRSTARSRTDGPFLEPISKSPEEDNEASELYEAEEVL